MFSRKSALATEFRAWSRCVVSPVTSRAMEKLWRTRYIKRTGPVWRIATRISSRWWVLRDRRLPTPRAPSRFRRGRPYATPHQQFQILNKQILLTFVWSLKRPERMHAHTHIQQPLSLSRVPSLSCAPMSCLIPTPRLQPTSQRYRFFPSNGTLFSIVPSFRFSLSSSFFPFDFSVRWSHERHLRCSFLPSAFLRRLRFLFVVLLFFLCFFSCFVCFRLFCFATTKSACVGFIEISEMRQKQGGREGDRASG